MLAGQSRLVLGLGDKAFCKYGVPVRAYIPLLLKGRNDECEQTGRFPDYFEFSSKKLSNLVAVPSCGIAPEERNGAQHEQERSPTFKARLPWAGAGSGVTDAKLWHNYGATAAAAPIRNWG